MFSCRVGVRLCSLSHGGAACRAEETAPGPSQRSPETASNTLFYALRSEPEKGRRQPSALSLVSVGSAGVLQEASRRKPAKPANRQFLRHELRTYCFESQCRVPISLSTGSQRGFRFHPLGHLRRATTRITLMSSCCPNACAAVATSAAVIAAHLPSIFLCHSHRAADVRHWPVLPSHRPQYAAPGRSHWPGRDPASGDSTTAAGSEDQSWPPPGCESRRPVKTPAWQPATHAQLHRRRRSTRFHQRDRARIWKKSPPTR